MSGARRPCGRVGRGTRVEMRKTRGTPAARVREAERSVPTPGTRSDARTVAGSKDRTVSVTARAPRRRWRALRRTLRRGAVRSAVMTTGGLPPGAGVPPGAGAGDGAVGSGRSQLVPAPSCRRQRPSRRLGQADPRDPGQPHPSAGRGRDPIARRVARRPGRGGPAVAGTALLSRVPRHTGHTASAFAVRCRHAQDASRCSSPRVDPRRRAVAGVRRLARRD